MSPINAILRPTCEPLVSLPCQREAHRDVVPATQDTLTPAGVPLSSSVTIDRPSLSPPEFVASSLEEKNPPTLSELRFLAAMEIFRSFGNEILSTLGIRLEAFRLHLQQISQENLKKLKEVAENVQTADLWSVLKKVANCLLSALSLVIGTSLVTTGAGTLIGGAMIGSGIFSLANLLMSEARAWDWVAKKLAHEDEERRKQLAMYLPAAVGITASIIGIFGSSVAYARSGIAFLDKTLVIAHTVLSLYNAATTLGKGIADSQLIYSEADLTQLKAEIVVERQRVDHMTKLIEDILDGLNAAHAKSIQFVNMAIRSNQAVVKSH